MEQFGCCTYHNMGMIIRNPYLPIHSVRKPDEIYILSTTPIHNLKQDKIKTSIRIRLLSEVLAEVPAHTVYIRRVKCVRNAVFHTTFRLIIQKIMDHPHDLSVHDWHKEECESFFIYPRSISFSPSNWCSVFLAYLCFQLHIVEPVNWSVIEPRDFSVSENFLSFIPIVEPEELLN